MKKRIFRNWGLKLASILLACILWLLVTKLGDPQDRRVFLNIPVTLVNTELLDSQNKFYEVLDNTDKVRVSIRGPKSVVEDLKQSDIIAEADVSKLTDINTIAINFSILNTDTNMDSIEIDGSPEVVKLNVEDKVHEWIRVQHRTIGEPAEGYMVGSTSVDQTMIEVTGPVSSVEKIKSAIVEIDVTGAASNLSANVEATFYDQEGNILELPNVTKSVSYIRMSVEVLAVKTVPVELNIMGNPANGYLRTGLVTCDPATVTIAGTPAVLAEVKKITIPEEMLDISGAEGNVVNTINIRPYLPDYVRLADSSFDGRIKATVYIEPKMEKTLFIPYESIDVVGLPEELLIEEPETAPAYELRVSGLEAAVASLDQNAIRGTADIAAWMRERRMEELEPGTYQIPVTFSLPDNITMESQVYMQITIIETEDL